MRCLHCRADGISPHTTMCPKCGIHLPQLLRDVLPPGTELRGGVYRIDYALGQGGFGITYRGTHTELQRIVAIKELFPQGLGAMRDSATGAVIVPEPSRVRLAREMENFVREGVLLGSVMHTNVVRVTDLVKERDTAYLIMDLVSGRTLRDVLLDAGPGGLAFEQVADIASQLVAALDATHGVEILHLDVKPENVIITRDGSIVLVDFGAARLTAERRTSQPFDFGYAAPELLGNASTISTGTDLFALAATIHELLTGKPPPPALTRIGGASWVPEEACEPIRDLLRIALEPLIDARPPSVREWFSRWPVARRGPASGPVTPGRRAPRPKGPPKDDLLIDVVPSADGAALRAALQRVGPGGTLRLGAGEHRLPSALILERPVTLVGVGMNETTLVCSAPESVVSVAASGSYFLHDLTVRHEGGRWADVVAVAGDATLQVVRCRITGARRDATAERGGIGLVALGTAKVEVNNCLFESVGWTGCLAREHADLTVRRSVISQAGSAGITIRDQAVASLTENRCEGNLQAGIVFVDNAAGEAVSNICRANIAFGIYVGGRSRPTLRGNQCEENGTSGIGFTNVSGGNADSNVCRRNREFGIAVMDVAEPTIIGGLCEENERAGIAFQEDARGSVTGCRSRLNRHEGIVVLDRATPILEQNELTTNRRSGLAYFAATGGVARHNRCAGNRANGIHVGGSAQPELEANDCSENVADGISIRAYAEPHVADNRARRNGGTGLYVAETAVPTLGANSCSFNGVADIRDNRAMP